MKRLLFLILFALPFTLLGEEVPRPASDGYRHMPSPWTFLQEQKPEGIRGDYRKLAVSPQTLPDPLLRYRVNTFAAEKESGNAYPLYLAALKEFKHHEQQAMTAFYRSDEYLNLDSEIRNNWGELARLRFKTFPLYSIAGLGKNSPAITAADEERTYRSLQNVYSLMEKGSKRTYFDWSDEYKYEGIATRLEFIQEARTLTRYLADKANWEIRNGNYNDAVKTIRIGLAHGEHILESHPPSFLVGMLVGLALKGSMYEQLFLLSVQPDAPNLYPALMQLTVNQRLWLDAIQSETHWLFTRHTDDDFWESLDDLSPEQAKTIFEDFVAVFASAGFTENEEAASLFRTMACLAAYLPAKNRLLQKGFSEKEVEALTTYQIVVPYVFEEIKRTYDLMIVEASMPQGKSHMAINFQEYLESKEKNPTNYPADMMLALLAPATQSARAAFYRQQQTLDLLKIVHAVRYYAAVHDGKLPASLEEITELAVPKICPITATPYQYRVEGRSVMIDYERHQRDTSRLEIVVE